LLSSGLDIGSCAQWIVASAYIALGYFKLFLKALSTVMHMIPSQLGFDKFIIGECRD